MSTEIRQGMLVELLPAKAAIPNPRSRVKSLQWEPGMRGVVLTIYGNGMAAVQVDGNAYNWPVASLAHIPLPKASDRPVIAPKAKKKQRAHVLRYKCNNCKEVFEIPPFPGRIGNTLRETLDMSTPCAVCPTCSKPPSFYGAGFLVSVSEE